MATRDTDNKKRGGVQGQIQEKTTQFLATLEHHVADRVTVFVHDVESQLAKHEVPNGPEEARRLEAHEYEVRETLASLEMVMRHLNGDEHSAVVPYAKGGAT